MDCITLICDVESINARIVFTAPLESRTRIAVPSNRVDWPQCPTKATGVVTDDEWTINSEIGQSIGHRNWTECTYWPNEWSSNTGSNRVCIEPNCDAPRRPTRQTLYSFRLYGPPGKTQICWPNFRCWLPPKLSWTSGQVSRV